MDYSCMPWERSELSLLAEENCRKKSRGHRPSRMSRADNKEKCWVLLGLSFRL